MVEIVKYSAKYKTTWDNFVRGSKNGTFLLRRDYMEYHAHRFTDHSLLFYRKGKLVALLPANEEGSKIHSHGGLTYGGIISSESMKATTMLGVFEAMQLYFRQLGFTEIRYKTIPHIYHRLPAEEDLYALFRCGAILYRRDAGSVIMPANRLPYNKLRQRKLKHSGTGTLKLQQSMAFADFMQMEQELLQTKYKAAPVHTAAEITQLASLFPRNIRLYAAFAEEAMLAGIIMYETETVAHCQYIGTTPAGREAAALDALVNYLLTDVYPHKPYFDFGISTEQQGQYLNEGLISNKESYGARSIVHDFYKLTL
ncbi:GNAT family N-acetyltransferase [Pontibacter sp. 172403-2]|uniref:GNAT family N-acetyltransferase n=1 Tax=Pontibacter rufus TaxID=2791028 RepID=UPI0018AF8B86|nr:GNAT family N-acetyltransferase [Pontibacter sp. 172403-2]MBF9253200.1 GNAT family N-acetyltransferase [Pontibacter sp. 172403-2]